LEALWLVISPTERKLKMTTTATLALHCPGWCDATHVNDPDGSHAHVVLGGATGDRFACVAIEQPDHGLPVIFVDVTDAGQTMSPEEALKVAAALRKAARLAGTLR
jgi:hypothetical protein